MKTLSLRGLSRDAPSLTEAVLVTHESQVIGRYVPISVAIDDRALAGLRPGEPPTTIKNVELHEVSLVEDTQANRDAGSGRVVRADPGFGVARPAPKPGKKK